MKPMSIWLRILNVRRSEWKLVKTLYFFEFFQGAGIAFFFTAAFALFLSKFSIIELPKVLIYSAFLLWVMGYVYTKLEARLNVIILARCITLFLAASFLLFRLALPIMPPGFLYLMLAWFNVLYLLNNLEFWGITSQLFDVRQGKRLFGLVSAGDIPAKFIGYTLALLMVSHVGTANLLWIGFVCMLASFPFLYVIDKIGNLKNNHQQHVEHKTTHSVSSLVKNFSNNLLVRRIAIITIVASSSFLIVNFSFYAKVKGALHSDVALAQFIALFFAAIRIFALFVKMIFTGRLINKLGIIKSLLITPVLMIFLICVVLILENFIDNEHLSLYLFGIMGIVVDVLRTSINTPVFLTLMQPLNTHERLRAHNITKGIMDPFASLITGLALLVVLNFERDMHLAGLNYILLLLGVLWIIGIYKVHQQYLKTLLKTIGNRFFYNTEFHVADSSTLSWIQEKLMSGSEKEAYNILRMMAAQPRVFKNEIVLYALDHPSDLIKTEAIKLSNEASLYVSKDKLRDILASSSNAILKSEIIKALCKTDLNEQEILPFVPDQNEDIQRAAMVGILNNGSAEVRQQVRAHLSAMINSEQSTLRKKAVQTLQELSNKLYREEVLQLINDSQEEIKNDAFIAAGKMKDAFLLGRVLDQINTYERTVIESLYLSSEISLPLLQSFILNRKANPRQTERLIRLIGRIKGEKSYGLLIQLMKELPLYLHSIIKTFYHANYTVKQEQCAFFEGQVQRCLKYCTVILYMQQLLMPQNEKYQLLLSSLRLELNNLRDTLLYFFALLYDREKIKDVRTAFESSKKETMANAMEIVEMTVKKEFAFHFNLIFEEGDIDYKTYVLKKLYPLSFFINIENILSTILDTKEFDYNFWTKACSIYTSKKQHHPLKTELIDKYIQADHPLLSEMARYAL